MSELQAKAAKLIDARNDLAKQLTDVHQAIENSITDEDRCVKVERHISKGKQLVEDIYSKCDQLLKLAPKVDDPEKFKKQLEDWLDELVAKNDHFIEKAQQYINNRKQNQRVDQESLRSKRSSRHSNQSSRLSRETTASQYQRALELAKLKTEEAVRQSDAALKIADQKRKAEQQRLQAEFDLKQAEFAEIAEQQRQKVEEAKLAETELEKLYETASSNIDSSSSVPAIEEDKTSRVNEWVLGNKDANVQEGPLAATSGEPV